MAESGQGKRVFGSGEPVPHQQELSETARRTFDAVFTYEPGLDRYRQGPVWLRVEEQWSDETLGVRIGLGLTGWHALPNLPGELAAEEDTENAFLGMATRLPANYIEHISGATLRYDTNSFSREGGHTYRLEYRALGTVSQVVKAAKELQSAGEIRWKKAHLLILGYLPGGEDPSDERARGRVDAMYGPGTAAVWADEIAAYDKKLGKYYQEYALSKLPPPPPPEIQPIRFDHEV